MSAQETVIARLLCVASAPKGHSHLENPGFDMDRGEDVERAHSSGLETKNPLDHSQDKIGKRERLSGGWH
jgi:hypothetical protein